MHVDELQLPSSEDEMHAVKFIFGHDGMMM